MPDVVGGVGIAVVLLPAGVRSAAVAWQAVSEAALATLDDPVVGPQALRLNTPTNKSIDIGKAHALRPWNQR
jgi:hypothetical protein